MPSTKVMNMNRGELARLVRRSKCGQTFPSLGYSASPCGGDYSNIIDLRMVKRSPKWFLRMMNLNVTKTRQCEDDNADLTTRLNHFPEYVSPSALYNRPHLLRELIKRGEKQFYVHKNGRKIKLHNIDEYLNNPEKAVQQLRHYVDETYGVKKFEDLGDGLRDKFGDVSDLLVYFGNKLGNKPYETPPKSSCGCQH